MADHPRTFLRELRLTRGLTQAALSGVTGTHKHRLHRYETGANDMNVETLLRFARALGVTPNDVLLPELLSSGFAVKKFWQLRDAAEKLPRMKARMPPRRPPRRPDPVFD
jgi:transcriptional regulator with XRE-family HTH domain